MRCIISNLVNKSKTVAVNFYRLCKNLVLVNPYMSIFILLYLITMLASHFYSPWVIENDEVELFSLPIQKLSMLLPFYGIIDVLQAVHFAWESPDKSFFISMTLFSALFTMQKFVLPHIFVTNDNKIVKAFQHFLIDNAMCYIFSLIWYFSIDSIESLLNFIWNLFESADTSVTFLIIMKYIIFLVFSIFFIIFMILLVMFACYSICYLTLSTLAVGIDLLVEVLISYVCNFPPLLVGFIMLTFSIASILLIELVCNNLILKFKEKILLLLEKLHLDTLYDIVDEYFDV